MTREPPVFKGATRCALRVLQSALTNARFCTSCAKKIENAPSRENHRHLLSLLSVTTYNADGDADLDVSHVDRAGNGDARPCR